MPETFEQKKLLSQRHFNDVCAQSLDETTPRVITAAVERFAETLGGTAHFVPVKPDKYGLFGWCSDGVLEKVIHDGGAVRFGWSIWEWPKILLTAEFHAIWVSPEGELIDITPKPAGETRIVFVANDSYPADFDFDQRPTNLRFRIPQEPNYKQLAQAEIARMKPSQLEYERKRATQKNVSLVDWIADKQPRSQFPLLVDELIQVCDALDRKTDRLSGARPW